MAVYKDGDKWRVIYRYTNWKGERKQTQKRGFATKRDAQAWEREMMLKSESKLDMTFASFFEIYEGRQKETGKGKHMGVQEPCYPHEDTSFFRGAQDCGD